MSSTSSFTSPTRTVVRFESLSSLSPILSCSTPSLTGKQSLSFVHQMSLSKLLGKKRPPGTEQADASASLPTKKKPRLLKKWPPRTCTVCGDVRYDMFGDQTCDDCQVNLLEFGEDYMLQLIIEQLDAARDNREQLHRMQWPFPVVAPVKCVAGEYYQPVPVSGFPYALSSKSAALRVIRPVDMQFDFCWRGTGSPVLIRTQPQRIEIIEPKWFRKWNACVQGSTFTHTQLVQGLKLLFRAPFLQEQPDLGLLMVHPTANKERYIHKTAQLARKFTQRGLYQDVINLILLLAYEDSCTLARL
jgi:hypothetical protein